MLLFTHPAVSSTEPVVFNELFFHAISKVPHRCCIRPSATELLTTSFSNIVSLLIWFPPSCYSSSFSVLLPLLVYQLLILFSAVLTLLLWLIFPFLPLSPPPAVCPLSTSDLPFHLSLSYQIFVLFPALLILPAIFSCVIFWPRPLLPGPEHTLGPV
jgi:hypothetical protein